MNRQNNFQASGPNYDPHIIPAESAVRQQREGKQYRHIPHDQAGSKSIRTSDGYSVDQEGLLNNYAIEPEMYVNVPGDLRQQAARQEAEWAHQLEELSEDEEGKLTMEHDWRHKGSGLI